ncbi:MAG: shikimate dehydrogenase [Synergistaceae bacterium]|jgi:shikimate dehydrogenase|nr:shikimate dehydrogenase [Synergistaceae bacterium]
MKSVALIGLSLSGKSSLGRMAANALGMPFIDVDSEIEREAGMPISQIFKLRGESFFRDAETRATISAAASGIPVVIAAGGGVVLRRENVAALRKSCFVVFLDRPVWHIMRGIPHDDSRPLLKSPADLRDMERERRALYLAAADAVIENDSDIEEGLARLLGLLRSDWPETPDEYAVIGDPLTHTLSPAIHGAVFAELGVTGRYDVIRISRGELDDFTRSARVSRLKGFNVTMPHKGGIIPLLDEVDEEAGLCGAVNTVIVRNGRLLGFNTDMGGLLESLREADRDFSGSRVMILGAGGAARGAAFKAAQEGASSVVILARRADRARKTAEDVGSALGFPGLVRGGEMSPEVMIFEARAADLVINATPAGMNGVGGDLPSLEFLEALPDSAFVCDLIYNPAETELLRRARELGLAARNGIGMLIYQALLADELFLNRKLDRPALYRTVEEMLTK